MTRTLQALKLGTLAAISAGGLLAGQAQAANPCSLLALVGPPGDVDACNFTDAASGFKVTKVSVTGFTPTTFDNLVYTISGLDLQAQLNFVGARTTTTTGTLKYTIELLNGKTFDTAQANITGNNGNFSTSTASAGLTSPATATGGPGTTVSFVPMLTSQDFIQSFSATPSGNLAFNSLGTIYSTTAGTTPPPQVPGPLPLLGAGAAFGFSRRLRNRIKVAV
jgi:MYXO-CTERM domain-containing protein